MSRTYPYKAWALLPSFKPTEIELKAAYASYSHQDYGDVSVTGKVYARSEIYPTKEAAIAGGWARVKEQEATLSKWAESLRKKKVALEKAAS